jgi:hypothetical protein
MNQRGNVIIEFAIILPLAILIILSIIYLAIERVDLIKAKTNLMSNISDEKDNTLKTEIIKEELLLLKEDITEIELLNKSVDARITLRNIALVKELLDESNMLENLYDYIVYLGSSHE